MRPPEPILIAYTGARLLRLTKGGLDPVSVAETEHFRLMREFWADPKGFVEAMITHARPPKATPFD